MRTISALAISACLTISACGSDSGGGGSGGGGSGGGDQNRLADLMLSDETFGFADEACVRDKTKELSDKDAKILADNIDAEDVEGLGLSPDGQLWVLSLIDCVGDITDSEFGS